jgi:DNA-binding NarL/FixJ family response regulator
MASAEVCMSKIPVLIVEDSEQSREVLEATVLGSPGLSLAGSVATPGDAIEAAIRLKPAILILDIFLKEGTGLDVLRAIREQGLSISIIVVTNAPSAALKRHCSDLGARYFFDKSLELEVFQNALRTLGAEIAPI